MMAAIQMVSGDDVAHNLAQAEQLIENSVNSGARLVVLPENFALFSATRYRVFAEREAQDKTLFRWLSHLARTFKIWLCAGTMPLLHESDNHGSDNHGSDKKVCAACLLLDDTGELKARYDKMHLFDVAVEDAHGSYRESDYMAPGTKPCVVDSPFGKLGLAICYDLRFPELFRSMALQGTEIFLIPCAFTETTGQAHWDVLTRARAVENLCYVVGANQGGQHTLSRKTYGHSRIVHPWGDVLSQWETGEGFCCAPTDLTEVRTLRKKMPVLEHSRWKGMDV